MEKASLTNKKALDRQGRRRYTLERHAFQLASRGGDDEEQIPSGTPTKRDPTEKEDPLVHPGVAACCGHVSGKSSACPLGGGKVSL